MPKYNFAKRVKELKISIELAKQIGGNREIIGLMTKTLQLNERLARWVGQSLLT